VVLFFRLAVKLKHLSKNVFLPAVLAFCSFNQLAQADVLMQIGASTGANNKIDTSKSYTYNFGVTSKASGLNLNSIIMGVGKSNTITEGITVEIYSAFGGAASGTQPISTNLFAASAFSGTSVSNYTLNFPNLNLAPGPYSIRIFSNTPTNQSYAFRDGLLNLGGTVTEEQWIQDSNTGGTAGTSITPSSGYVLADAATSTASVNIGRFHTNTSPSATLNVSNSAPASTGQVTESLTVAQGSVTGAASVLSLPGSHLAQGISQQVNVALTAAAGAQSGNIQLNFASVKDGSNSTRAGSDPVSLGSTTIQVSGTGYTGSSAWNTEAGGSWNKDDFNKWSDEGGTPGLDGDASVGDSATFGAAISANSTISLNGSAPKLKELVFDNGAASYTIAQGTSGSLTMGNATNAGNMKNLAGSHTISANIGLGNRLDFTGDAGSSTNLSGILSGGHGLTKEGTGTLRLSGANTYSGSTQVKGGTLVINGSTSTGALQVDSGATLMGSGTIGGATTIFGIHSPGNSPGVQTFEDDLTYTTGSSIVWELIDNSLAARGTNYDGIDVEGNLTFSEITTITLDFALAESGVEWANEFWSDSYTGVNGWKIFDVTGTINGFEDLSLAGNLLDSKGILLTTGRSNAFFSLFKASDGIYLNYNAIPEPSSALLGGIGILLLLRRKR
jgi:autotransporter-associated beta strand protein